MLVTDSKFMELEERFEGSSNPDSPMYQQAGRIQCALVYLHTNGEMEGFVAFGDTERESEDRCLNRMTQKLGHYIGQGFNMARVHTPSILNKLSGFEAQSIMDDFQFSRNANKF